MYIPFLLKSLGNQSFRNFRLVAVVKPSNDNTEKIIRKFSDIYDFDYNILTQKNGNVATALQLGVDSITEEDIILITDDDAILPRDHIENHVKIYQKSPKIGIVSGNILNYDLKSNKVLPLETGKPWVRFYRTFIRPCIDKPHRYFMKYRLGVYITKDYNVVAGPCIPFKKCFSLPCRGVNLSFRADVIKVRFPIHPSLKRCPNWEQYVGVQFVMNGWDAVYYPQIFVYHIVRKSLSRTRNKKELLREKIIMKDLFKELIASDVQEI